MAGDSRVDLFDGLPCVPPLALRRILFATRLALASNHLSFDVLTRFLRTFLCLKFLFEGAVGWVFGALVAGFVSAVYCIEEVGFIVGEPV